MDLGAVVDDLEANPHRARSFYEYPELYEFFHAHVLDRDAQVSLLERFRPDETRRVIEFGCGTGPLLARIEDEYEEVLGVDANEAMAAFASDRLERAEVRVADFTEWSAADEGRAFDAAVLMGGLLHLTDDADVTAFAANVRESLRDGGTFATFFTPFSDDVRNATRDVQSAESDRYVVERHSLSALTSSAGHYTTVYRFRITDRDRDREAEMGTVFRGRFHDPNALRDAFSTAGFRSVELFEGSGSTLLCATK